MKRRIYTLFIVLAFLLASSIASADYSVGAIETFWTWDLTQMPPTDEQITAVCQGVGDNVYVFIEETAWDAGEMDSDDVDAFIEAFDSKTPAGSYNPDW